MAEGVQGYLVVTVVEASGKSRDDTYVWDDTTKEGYVKGEWKRRKEGRSTGGNNASLSARRDASRRVCASPGLPGRDP